MSHPDQQVYSIDLTNMNEEQWDEFQDIMNQVQDEYINEVGKLALELNCTIECANDVMYLRGRSRWTQEHEDKLIQLHKEGNPPNICEWP